jgi:hypothetical protein
MRKKMDNARRTGPALEKAYQFVLWLLPTVEKFPRGQRLLLGDRIQTTVLEVTEGIVEATYSAQSGPSANKLPRLFLLAGGLPAISKCPLPPGAASMCCGEKLRKRGQPPLGTFTKRLKWSEPVNALR